MGQSMIFKRSCLMAALLMGAASANASDQWPMYQANPAHTGYIPVSITPANIAFKWKKQLGTAPLNPVTAAQGLVFVSTVGYFANQGLYTLAKSGQQAWKVSYGAVFSVNPPSYANGTVYIQVGKSTTGNPYFYGYKANNGTLLLKSLFDAQWERYFAPTIYDGSVYVNGGYYGGMYSFNGLTGAQNWFAQEEQYDQWTPAVDDKWAYAYVGGAPGLYVTDRLTGKPVFTIADPNFQWNGYSIDSAPVLGGANAVYTIHDGRLIKFDTNGRKIAWQKASSYTGQPTLANGVLYAVSAGALVAVNPATGNKVWLWDAPVSGELQSNIIATKTHLFVGTADTTYCIDLKTHKSVWSYPASGNLTLAESALYIAGNAGELAAFKLGLGDLFVPASLPIKATPVNTTTSRTITITNVGDTSLTVSAIASGSPVFVASSAATPFVIAPNQSKAIHVSFTPTSATVFNADLTINSDDPNEPVSLVHLQGKGI